MRIRDSRRTGTGHRAAMASGVLALLTACGDAPRPAPVAESPQRTACRAEARNSPEVKEIMQRQPAADRVTWRIVWEQDVAEAERRHALDCMRRAGLALLGGVEAPAPRINSEVLGSPLR